MESNVEIADRFAEMWKKSRAASGKSQAYVAKALGVSKATVQHWEDGTSCPSQILGLQWFKVLDIQPLPYYLELLYPEEYEDISSGSSDQDIEDALIAMVKALPTKYKRELLYCAYGEHGSSPLCVLEMVTADLHTPLHNRINIAHDIVCNYEIANERNQLVCPDNVKPDMAMLREAYQKAKKSVIAEKTSYCAL